MFIYESCIGNLYGANYPMDYSELICETCGDCDDFIGEFDNIEDFISTVANGIHTKKNSGGYELDYIYKFACDTFKEEMSKEDFLKIILENQDEETFDY